jgi:hypothetical protein
VRVRPLKLDDDAREHDLGLHVERIERMVRRRRPREQNRRDGGKNTAETNTHAQILCAFP